MLKEKYMNNDVGLEKKQHKFNSAIHLEYSLYTLIDLYTHTKVYVMQV